MNGVLDDARIDTWQEAAGLPFQLEMGGGCGKFILAIVEMIKERRKYLQIEVVTPENFQYSVRQLKWLLHERVSAKRFYLLV